MTTTPNVARDTLYTVLMLDGVHGRGHTPDRSEKASELIDGYRDQVLAEHIPAWEAIYEPGNVSDYLIGYTNDEIPAKRAAEAWFRAQRLDEVGAIDWISDPAMAVREYDVWHELVEVGDDFEVLSKPGIIVRHRAAQEG